jgi:hypothetical protein
VALLAPVTMIGVLVVLALGGGFGGLGALGQLVSGPAVPAGTNVPGGRAGSGSSTQVLPVVPASTAAALVGTRAPTRVAVTSPGVGRAGGSAGGSSHAGSGGQRVSPAPGHGATPPVSAPAPTPPGPPVSTPSPAPGPVPALVNQVVAVGVSVTSKLPAPLAAIGTGALESVGQALNSLLAPHS